MVTVVVKNDKIIVRQLEAAGRVATSGQLVAALVAAAEVVKREAQRRAPYLTGELRESIHVEVGGAGGSIGHISAVIGSVGVVSVAVVVGAPYGRRIELGFVGRDRLGRAYHDPPHPYLRPAVQSTRNQVRATLAEGIRQELRRAIL